MGTKPKNNDKSPAKDRCQTPDYALFPLLPYLPEPDNTLVWEPARGEGYLVGALRARGFNAIEGDILYGQDYFDDRHVPTHYTCQITNPPFSLKYKWLERAYDLGKPFALLMPADTLFAGTAQKMFQRHGFTMLLPDKRIDFKMPNKGWGGSAQFTSAWFLWGFKNAPEGLVFVDLDKPTRRGGKNAPAHLNRAD